MSDNNPAGQQQNERTEQQPTGVKVRLLVFLNILY